MIPTEIPMSCVRSHSHAIYPSLRRVDFLDDGDLVANRLRIDATGFDIAPVGLMEWLDSHLDQIISTDACRPITFLFVVVIITTDSGM